MMKKIFFLMVILLGACHKQMVPQNEDMAIGIANLFLKELAHGNYVEVYKTYMDDSIKQESRNSLEGLEDYYSELQERYGPMSKAVFDAFQGVPGENALQLFYNITHEKKGVIVYHLVLAGDADRGYKVKILDIGNHHLYPSTIGQYPDIKRMRKVGVVEVELGLSK